MALSDKDKRTLRIGGIAVGVLIVGFLLLKLLGGGGGEEATSPPVFPSTSGGPPVSPSVTPTPGPQVVLVFSGRDPFSPPPALAITSGTPTPSTSSPTPTPTGTSHAVFLGSTIVDGKTFTLSRVYLDGGVERADVRFDARSF